MYHRCIVWHVYMEYSQLSRVAKERDEVYDNYLIQVIIRLFSSQYNRIYTLLFWQPLSAYNISRKELHNLLMKQQATASELDNQRDQTLK